MTSDVDKPCDRTEAALYALPEWLVQWPMILFTGWWDAVFDAWHPSRCPHAPAESHDLVVPDRIENEGEHALFA